MLLGVLILFSYVCICAGCISLVCDDIYIYSQPSLIRRCLFPDIYVGLKNCRIKEFDMGSRLPCFMEIRYQSFTVG